MARELQKSGDMSWIARLLRRWGFIRLDDFGLALTPAGELALRADPSRVIAHAGMRDLGPAVMMSLPALADTVPMNNVPTPAPEDEDWDRLMREAKARAAVPEARAQRAAEEEVAEPEDDDDWYDLLAAAKARASSLPMPPESAEEDSVTTTRVSLRVPEDDEDTGVDLAAEVRGNGDDEITDIAPRRRQLTKREQHEIAHEPTQVAPLGLAEAQRRRAAAQEARRLSQRGHRTLTGMPLPRGRATPPPLPRRAIGTRPPDQVATCAKPVNDAVPAPARERTVIGPAPARPAPRGQDAPLPRLTTRFGAKST